MLLRPAAATLLVLLAMPAWGQNAASPLDVFAGRPVAARITAEDRALAAAALERAQAAAPGDAHQFANPRTYSWGTLTPGPAAAGVCRMFQVAFHAAAGYEQQWVPSTTGGAGGANFHPQGREVRAIETAPPLVDRAALRACRTGGSWTFSPG